MPSPFNNSPNPLPAVDAYWLLRQWKRRAVADRHPARALLVLQLESAVSAIGHKLLNKFEMDRAA